MAKKEKEATVFENWEAEVPEGWVTDESGLPPYWKPELGRSFTGTVIDFQPAKNNLDFDRYVILSSNQIICSKGASEDAEDVTVTAGGKFTVSNYAALPLNEYLGFEIKVITFKNSRLPGNEASGGAKRDLWQFKVLTSPETKKQLDDFRKLDAERQRMFIKEARLKGLKAGNDQVKNGNTKAIATVVDSVPF